MSREHPFDTTSRPVSLIEPQTLSADLFLIHAPSVYDFRELDDVLFAYLSDSSSVNVTSVYEMYPIGFLAIEQHLRENGLDAKIVNLASLMLMHPHIDVDRLLSKLEAPVFGLDLHWMTQSHGSIEIAKKLKQIHPESLIIFGGMSATYYADELITHPAVDVVVKGYDTLQPVAALIQAAKAGGQQFDHIPNLLYKDLGSEVTSTGFSHKPTHDYNDATIDWSFYREAKSEATATRLIMTLPNTGCSYDCPWCGGSRFAYGNIMGLEKTLISKDNSRVLEELRTLGDAARTTSIYALQCYSESKARLCEFLDAVKEMEYKSVLFEQVFLPERDTLERMVRSTDAYIMLSPESHDHTISKLAGRGQYTMDEMEAWIPMALDAGIKGVMVWFFIGMPQQTRGSVLDTVDYCEQLLRKFKGQHVLPLLCPMVPFLDPGSRFFEEPQKHGYTVFYRTLEEHRRAMVEPSWHKRLNYETKWLSRLELRDITYEAIARLVTIKGELGVLPRSVCQTVLASIEETTSLLGWIDSALQLDGSLPADLRSAIRDYNRRTLAYSSDQIIPTHRAIGGRWFDDFTVPAALLS